MDDDISATNVSYLIAQHFKNHQKKKKIIWIFTFPNTQTCVSRYLIFFAPKFLHVDFQLFAKF